MIITQKSLIRQIARNEAMNIATVQKVFRAAEDIIYDHLSSTSPSESTTIKLFDGLSLECSYVPEKNIHTYDDIVCRPRLRVKPKITRYYNQKLNN